MIKPVALFAPAPVQTRSILFYAIGYPGSGKTTVAKRLSKHMGLDHLYADRIAFELFRLPKYTPQEAAVLYGTMDQQASDKLRSGRSVIYDAMANSHAMRNRLVRLAKAHGCHAVGIWVRTPVEIAKQRSGGHRPSEFIPNQYRTVPERVFVRHVTTFEAPQPYEAIIPLSGLDDVETQIKALKAGLVRLKIAKSMLSRHQPISTARGFEFTHVPRSY